MNMFAKFDENPAMTHQGMKKTKRYGRTDARTTWKQYTHHKQSLRGYNKIQSKMKVLECSQHYTFIFQTLNGS